MKKLILKVFAVSTVFIASCNSNTKNNQPVAVSSSTVPDIHDIDFCEATKLVKEFKINAGGEANRTKSVWYEIAEIHKLDSLLIAEKDSITKYNIAHHIDPKLTTDGVRIYFARYTNEYDANHRNKNTIVIISTKEAIDPANPAKHMHLDYYPTCSMPMTPKNNGELCPDHCDGVKINP